MSGRFLGYHTWGVGRVLSAFSEERPCFLLNTLQCTEQPQQQRIFYSEMLMLSRLRYEGKEETNHVKELHPPSNIPDKRNSMY